MQGLNIANFVTPSFEFLALNQNPQKPAGAILQDVKVRQALYYAINRPAMIKSILFGEGSNATGVEPPTSWAYDPNAKPQYDVQPCESEPDPRRGGLDEGLGWDAFQERDATRLHPALPVR